MINKYLKVNEIVDSVSITHKFDKPSLYAINTSDVYQGNILSPEFMPISELKGQFKKTIKNGDILFSEIRPANQRYAKVRIEDTNEYVASTKLMVLRKFNKDVDDDYFYYWLTNNDFLSILQSRAENRICSFPQITFEILSEYAVPIPNLIIQRKIASVLKSIDDKISNNNRINAELESMAKTIYDYWFTQFDFPDENGKPYKSSGGKMVWNEELKREIPEGWGVGRVKDCIVHINTGLNPRDNFKLGNGNIKYITVKNLTTHGAIDFSNCDIIDEEARKIVHNRSDVSKGDILFASIAPLGRCCIVYENPMDWDINESVFSIRPQNNIPSEYLYLYFMSDTFVKKAEHSSTGSGIRISTLEEMNIVIPPDNVLENFEKNIAMMLLRKHKNSIENQQLASLRDWLLPMLMNGQVGFEGVE